MGVIPDVLALVAAATERDGVGPLSEHALLALKKTGTGTVRRSGGEIVGYAFRDDESAELVVHPDHRRQGHGRALARSLLPTRFWAHGDLPAAAALARSLGLARVRALFQLRLSFGDTLPEPVLPEGVRIRTFE